ncbi:MAG: 3-hydroxyacyl-CoA dehydrogenase [Microbacteriaceae bacterium]|nr:3-hydroxyacyl-CoA dehydrogenase [Microbacteriaceae bacterium]
MQAKTSVLTGSTLISGLLDDARRMSASAFASPRDIDVAMRLGAGYPIGPFGLTTAELFGEQEILADANPWSGSIGVVGTGHMATGIAEAIARAGQPVVLWGRSAASVSAALEGVASRLATSVARGRDTEEGAAEVRSRIRGTTEFGELATSPVVIEAVVEDLAVKQDLFALLDATLPRSVRLATNTSSFRLTEVVDGVGAGRATLALHFFNPAPRMRLVEIVTGDAALMAEATEWVRTIDKVSVASGDQRGFIVNRLLIPYLNDSVRELERGATVEQIENVATAELGQPMGPLTLIDLIGIDVTVAALNSMSQQDPDPRLRPASTLERMLAAGILGRKSGSGFVVGTGIEGAR